jgi:alkylhydroperoxidase family enzyme
MMPRLPEIPLEDIPAEGRAHIEKAVAAGMVTTTAPLQVVAHSAVALQGTLDSYAVFFQRGALGSRLLELLRLRSAQLGDCAPCGQSRKDDSVTEDDVACLVAPSETHYTKQEIAALHFLDQFATDHHAIDDASFDELRQHFTNEQIVELGFVSWQYVGGHRFMHVLNVTR